MSIQAVAWALEQNLPASAKLVLVSIANHANHADGYCWLKAETISREASCTTRNVYRVVSALCRNGYLRKEARRGADGKQRATDYWMLLNREGGEWHWFDSKPEDGEPQDIAEPDEPCSHGDEAPESTGSPAARMTPGDQPYDSGVIHIDEPSSEPSKPNEIKKEELDDLAVKTGLRSYQAPAPAVEAPSGEPPTKVFVIEGTPAWKAWDAHLRRTRGRGLSFSYRGEGEHRTKSGRHFPSLWPPPATAADGVNEEAAKDFAEAETKRGDQC